MTGAAVDNSPSLTYVRVSRVASRTPRRYGPMSGRRNTSPACTSRNAIRAGVVPMITADHYMWTALFDAPWNRRPASSAVRALPSSSTFGAAIPATAGNRCYATNARTQQLPALSPHPQPVGYEQLYHSHARAEIGP